MTPENFTYWLQGFFEIGNITQLSEVQVQIIKDHLDLVFKKETPNRVFVKEISQDINSLSPSVFNSSYTLSGRSFTPDELYRDYRTQGQKDAADIRKVGNSWSDEERKNLDSDFMNISKHIRTC